MIPKEDRSFVIIIVAAIAALVAVAWLGTHSHC